MYEWDVIESELENEGNSEAVFSKDEALGFYRSLSRSGSARPADFVACGDSLMSFGAFEPAHECYSQAILRDAGYLAAYLQRGELRFQLAVGAENDDAALRHGQAAVSDFRTGMLISLGSEDVVWKLGTALLVVGDVSVARDLVEKVLVETENMSEEFRRDFLYLLGFSKLFMGEREGASESFNKMLSMGGGCGEALFGILAVAQVSGDLAEAGRVLRRLSVEDPRLLVAGGRLSDSGCQNFLQVVRALMAVTLSLEEE